VGSRVRVEIDDSENLEIELVRANPNPDEGRVGIHTPLGSALLEATVGEEIEYTAGEALRTARVVEVADPS
jgi:transcription elongation GreA/GreB family factor